MKEILENVFAVEVPRDARNFELHENALRIEFGWKNVRWVDLDGSYETLFTTKDCTEEQVQKIVENKRTKDSDKLYFYTVYKNYNPPAVYHGFEKASESLQSLLRSHGLSTDKNYLLLRKTS